MNKLQPCKQQKARKIFGERFILLSLKIFLYKRFGIFYSKIVTSLMQYDNKKIYKKSLSISTSPDTLLNNEMAPRFHITKNRMF